MIEETILFCAVGVCAVGLVKATYSKKKTTKENESLRRQLRQKREEEGNPYAYFGRFNSFYEVKTITRQVRKGIPLAEVAFLLPDHDWCELQKQECWRRVVLFLTRKESMYAQLPRTMEQGTMETLSKESFLRENHTGRGINV